MPKFVKLSKQILIVLGVLMIPLLMNSGCSKGTDEKSEEAPVAIRVIQPVIKTMENRMSYIGTVHSRQEVRVIARVQGTVRNLPYEEGARIRRGEVIAELSAPEIRAKVERLTAERDYWCNRWEEDKRLVEKEVLAPEQAQVSERACKSARAALAEAQSQLDKISEKAPFNGEVLKWFVEPGQSVMPGQPILLIGDDPLEIQVDVVEEDLQRGVQSGMPVKIEVGQEFSFSSKVSEISPISSGPTRTFVVKVPVPPSVKLNLRKGSSVRTIFIIESKKDVITVPVNAVADEDTDPHIFLVSQNTAKRQEVKVGIEQQGWIEVDFPWNGEDWVAVTNLGSLTDGSRVFAVKQEEVK